MTNILNIPVIASGGVGNLNHFKEGVITGGASALLAASVFHFNKFSISEVEDLSGAISTACPNPILTLIHI